MSIPTTPWSLYLTHSLKMSSLNWGRPLYVQIATQAIFDSRFRKQIFDNSRFRKQIFDDSRFRKQIDTQHGGWSDLMQHRSTLATTPKSFSPCLKPLSTASTTSSDVKEPAIWTDTSFFSPVCLCLFCLLWWAEEEFVRIGDTLQIELGLTSTNWTWVSNKEVWAKSAFNIEKSVVGSVLAKFDCNLKTKFGSILVHHQMELAFTDIRCFFLTHPLNCSHVSCESWRSVLKISSWQNLPDRNISRWKIYTFYTVFSRSHWKIVYFFPTSGWDGYDKYELWWTSTWKPERKSVRLAGAPISTWEVRASREPSPGSDKPCNQIDEMF